MSKRLSSAAQTQLKDTKNLVENLRPLSLELRVAALSRAASQAWPRGPSYRGHVHCIWTLGHPGLGDSFARSELPLERLYLQHLQVVHTIVQQASA